MGEILNMLDIKISYKERKNQVENYLNRVGTNYSILSLTVISTSLDYKQKVFTISPGGMIIPQKSSKDGVVLFGYGNEKLNDFIFPVSLQEENKEIFELPSFAIYFNTTDESYYIKDLNTGVGALMKIKKYKIMNNTLINIGSNYLVIYLEEDKIIIKIFNNTILENNANGENCDCKEFTIDKSKNSFITIGRSQNNDISIEDMELSKVQCCIEFNSNENAFYLYDGDSKKESTNGTWVYILNPKQITNNFLFKAEHTLFIASLSDNK